MGAAATEHYGYAGLFDGMEVGAQKQWAQDLRAGMRLKSPHEPGMGQLARNRSMVCLFNTTGAGRATETPSQSTGRRGQRYLSPGSRLVLDTFEALIIEEQQQLACELRAGMGRRRRRR